MVVVSAQTLCLRKKNVKLLLSAIATGSVYQPKAVYVWFFNLYLPLNFVEFHLRKIRCMAKSRFLNRYVHSVRLSVSRPTCQYFLSFELGNYVVFISFFILFYFLFKQFICMNIATNKNCFPRKILPCNYLKFYMIKKIYFKLSKPVKCSLFRRAQFCSHAETYPPFFHSHQPRDDSPIDTSPNVQCWPIFTREGWQF